MNITRSSNPTRRTRSRLTTFALSGSLCLAFAMSACGSDTGTTATTSPTTTAAATTTPATPAPTTTAAPKPTPTTARPTPPPTTARPTPPPTTAHVDPTGPAFASFDVSRSAACTSGNAEFTMGYTTRDMDDMFIDIGSTGFKETAGYSPNETRVIATVPCAGAGQSTIQMKGCNTSGACGESAKVTVTIEAG